MKQTWKRTRKLKIQKPDTLAKYLKINHLRLFYNLLLFSLFEAKKCASQLKY